MDNFHLDITAKGDRLLEDAMMIAFTRGDGKPTTAEGYLVDPEKGLIFFWYTTLDKGVIKLPFKLDSTGAADFARRWLAEQDYGKEPGHDGSNSKGWRLYNTKWSRVDDYQGSIIAVLPNWAWHGK
jgi:hypothetical protein